jgi:dienelactone hydrolase
MEEFVWCVFCPPLAPRSKAAGPGILSVLLLALAAIGLATASACAKPAKAVEVKKAAIQKFKNGATEVTVEQFAPAREGKYPAIILLHDSAGLQGPGPLFRMCAQILAGEGYVVLLVHYFDGTPHRRVEKQDVHKKVFQTWLGNVAGAVRHARTLKNVDPQRIGLCGFSLGGYLAMAAATQKELKIAAVAEFFGGLPDDLWQDLKHLPPTLIMHGDQDRIVSVKEAYALRGVCEACKFQFEIKIYAGQDHLFRNGFALKDFFMWRSTPCLTTSRRRP